jgi:hypothetical protein
MKSSLRPTSVDDLSALTQFLARAFCTGPDAAFLNPAMMAWKYWDRRDDWSAPRSFVLEREGAIVAHAGIWPMTYGAGPEAMRGIQMIDWASSREWPGAGLALVQKLGIMFDFIYSIGGSEMTQKVLPAFGFAAHAQEWRGVRPLRPLQQALTHQTRDWKLVPRLARNLSWAMPRAGRPKKNWDAVEILLQDISPELYRPDVFGARPAAFFEYLLRCPTPRFGLYGIVAGTAGTQSGAQVGHFAIGVVRGQARVAGIWLREPTEEAWSAAYALAQQTALRLKGVCEIVAAGSSDSSRRGAAQAGFRILQGPPVYVLDKKKKLPPSPEIQFQLCDDDAAFLDAGTVSYWS